MMIMLTDAELAAAVAKLRRHYPEHDREVLGSAILDWLVTEAGEWLADIEGSCVRVGDFELSLQAVEAALGAAI